MECVLPVLLEYTDSPQCLIKQFHALGHGNPASFTVHLPKWVGSGAWSHVELCIAMGEGGSFTKPLATMRERKRVGRRPKAWWVITACLLAPCLP